MSIGTDDIERFWSHCVPEPNTGCWLWEGGLTGTGYGIFRIGSLRDGSRRMVTASRFACEVTWGKIPDGMQALHKCDVKICVNPDHLYIGTRSQNAHDAFDRGQKIPHRLLGETNPKAKLTVDDVIAIRQSGESLTRLSKRYGVSKTQISHIKQRKSWSHVN